MAKKFISKDLAEKFGVDEAGEEKPAAKSANLPNHADPSTADMVGAWAEYEKEGRKGFVTCKFAGCGWLVKNGVCEFDPSHPVNG